MLRWWSSLNRIFLRRRVGLDERSSPYTRIISSHIRTTLGTPGLANRGFYSTERRHARRSYTQKMLLAHRVFYPTHLASGSDTPRRAPNKTCARLSSDVCEKGYFGFFLLSLCCFEYSEKRTSQCKPLPVSLPSPPIPSPKNAQRYQAGPCWRGQISSRSRPTASWSRR